MAAAFGIWELRMPSLRAVDEDDDDENHEITEDKEIEFTPSFVWSNDAKNVTNSSKFVCSSVILAVGETATTFLEAYFLCGGNSDTVGVISERHDINDFNWEMNPKSKSTTCVVHRLSRNQDCLIVQCPTHVDERKVFYWTRKIFDNIKPCKAIILTSAPVCDYMTSDPQQLPADFLKMLHTSCWRKEDRPCSYLETPNTVRGLAASVLSHCQVHDIPGALFVCFTATRQLDVQAVKAFGKLLESKQFSVFEKYFDQSIINDIQLHVSAEKKPAEVQIVSSNETSSNETSSDDGLPRMLGRSEKSAE